MTLPHAGQHAADLSVVTAQTGMTESEMESAVDKEYLEVNNE